MRRSASINLVQLVAAGLISLALSGCGVGRAISNAAYDLQHLELGRLNPFSDDPPPVRVEGETVAEVIAALPDVLPETISSEAAGSAITQGGVAQTAPAAAGADAAANTADPEPSGRSRSSAALDDVIARYEQVLPSLSDEGARFAVQKRVTDLKLERATFAADPTRYAEVIAAYEQLLRSAGPDATSTAPGLRYQLARARDLAGQTDGALADLDRIIAEANPATDLAVLREAHFRRGEAAFARGQYAAAASDYAAARGTDSKYGLHAGYMLGWSHFRSGAPAKALDAFYEVVEQIGSRAPESLAGSEQEMLADVLRASVLALERTGGVATLATAMRERGKPGWQALLYDAVGTFYLQGKRFQDAAGAFELYERENPLVLTAPKFALRAIDALMDGGFPSEAAARKPRFVERYGAGSAFHGVHGDAGIASYGRPLRAFIEEQTAQLHAKAQREPSPAAYAEAARWYRIWLTNFDRAPAEPGAPDAATAAGSASSMAATDAEIGEHIFLLGETLIAGEQLAAAVPVMRGLVRRMPAHPRAREAGYATVLALTTLSAADAALAPQLLAAELDFADRFGDDPRAPDVQIHAARSLLTRQDHEGAALAAENALTRWALAPVRAGLAHRIAAEGRLARAELPAAEAHFAAARALAVEPAEQRELQERVLATVGQQAELAEKSGDVDAAIGHLQRLTGIAPDSELAIAGGLNVASLYLQAGNLAAAAAQLAAARTAHPEHPLVRDVALRLADLYEKLQQPDKAARELMRVASSTSDASQARAAHYHATELLLPVDPTSAERLLEDYVGKYPTPVSYAAEAVASLRALTATRPQQLAQWRARQMALFEKAGPGAELGRARLLAADVALELADVAGADFSSRSLTQPLNVSLTAKRAALDTAIAAYEKAGGYGEPRVVTTATLAIARMYAQLATDLRASPRPDGLSAEGAERYEAALETRAAAIVQQAVGVHQLNAARARDGLWDDAIAASFAALAQLDPGAFARVETNPPLLTLAAAVPLDEASPGATAGDEASADDADPGEAAWRAGDLAAAQRVFAEATTRAPGDARAWTNLALAQHATGAAEDALASLAQVLGPVAAPDALTTNAPADGDRASAEAAPSEVVPAPNQSAPENVRCAAWTLRGLLQRQRGQLSNAERSYRECLRINPNHVLAWRNLGVLYELYMVQPGEALAAYQHAQTASAAPDADVAAWIARIEGANAVSSEP